ncbi:uncharacterized protein LOC134727629 [Mytilus trossulus]|uniref:uncharacterized protein LOC134727629 n=1 Tax=Mytilus trossulus TaxID=6551 RepID=UPI003006A787
MEVLNGTAINDVKQIMASTEPTSCGPCKKIGETISADLWCYNCDEGFCSTCSNHHKRFNGTQDHKTIDVKSHKPSIRQNYTECDKHGKQLHSYCPNHLVPCCEECISSRHSKCCGIKTLASVVERTKIEKMKASVERAEQDINDASNMYEQILNMKLKNVKTGEDQYLGIEKSIEDIRKEINKHLDKLKEKICRDAETIWNQEKSAATDFISEVEGRTKSLKEIKANLPTVMSHASKLQSFLCIHQIEQQVYKCLRYIEDWETDERVREFDIKLAQNSKIENILSKLKSLESLGEVIVTRKELSHNGRRSMTMAGYISSQFIIEKLTMHIWRKVETKKKRKISDMICLMDGRVIVVEQHRNVNLHVVSSDGKSKPLLIPDNAYSISQINLDTIAISYPSEKIIKIFNMENEKVINVIPLNKDCWGLSFANNSLAVGLSKDEILIIDLAGDVLKSLQVQSESNLCNLVNCDDRIIYSDYEGHAIYCIDVSGKTIWQYKQDLRGPQGLCTDKFGNILVADGVSNKIIVVARDGQGSKELVGEEDIILRDPRCICFKHNVSSGFICDNFGKYFAEFNLSYG